MVTNRLKYFRVKSAKTQTQAAKAAGVTQPSYQRWETSKVEIPKSYLTKLARYFKATEAELLGTNPPREAAFYDDEAPADLQYYGELAVHFVGGGKPLVLSISEAARTAAYQELLQGKRFVVIKDLGNRTVAIRHKSIAEFYFSSEAYDWYGPEEEHESYECATPIQMPDTRDWAIVEAIRGEELGVGDCTSKFSKEDVKRVQDMIMITDEQFDELVAQGAIKPEDLETEKAARAADTAEIMALADTVMVQFSTGKRREFTYADCNLFEVIEPLIDIHYPYGDDDDLKLIHFPHEGYHQTAFFNPDVIDFISVPTHKIEEGETDVNDELLIELDDDDGEDGKVIKLPKGRKKGKG